METNALHVNGLGIGVSPVLGGEYGAIARHLFEVGDVVFRVSGPELREPTIYSFQAGVGFHVDPTDPATGCFGVGHFVNHSCDPSTGWVRTERTDSGIVVVFKAIRPIAAGEEATFDYATNEFDTASQVECGCGSDRCRGRLMGWKDLLGDWRRRYIELGIVPPYLLERS